MLFQSKHRKIKARLISIGSRDGYQEFVTPGRKGIFEFNGWVLREKLKLGFVLALTLGLGAVLVALGWYWVLAGAIILFLVGFIKGGDVEAGP